MQPCPFVFAPQDLASLKPREKILAAAHRLFYAEGIRGTGVDRIIAEASVTKVTFYRQFPSKDALILAYLDDRHRLWMQAFEDAVRRHRSKLESIVPALQEWFACPSFRGCAFINALGELGGTSELVIRRVREHKQELLRFLESLVGETADGREVRCILTAMEGAIVQAAWGEPEPALESLRSLIGILASKPNSCAR
jgi:AcrR family transcriptional regulator